MYSNAAGGMSIGNLGQLIDERVDDEDDDGEYEQADLTPADEYSR